MTSGLLRLAKQFLLRSDSAGIAIPPMDGPLTPNELLSEAKPIARVDAPRELAEVDGTPFVAVGREVLSLDTVTGDTVALCAFPTDVGALCGAGPDRLLAAVVGVGLVAIRPSDGHYNVLSPAALACPTALTARGDVAVIAEGSSEHGIDEWPADLMAKGRTGSLTVVDLVTGSARRLVDGLRWCSGVLLLDDDTIIYSEAWAHHVMTVPLAGGGARRVTDELPFYPGQLSPAVDGGCWLAGFAARSHLVEFVLTQDQYRAEMVATIPPEHWIRPSLIPSESGLDPLQGGQLKKLGSTKPWAPARSYGVVLRLDDQLRPVESYHSRANNRTHGVVGIIDRGNRLLVASVGRGAVVELPTKSRDAAEERA